MQDQSKFSRLSLCELQCNSNIKDAMAANALVQTRIDRAIKDEATAVLAAMGLTVSDAVRLLLTKVSQVSAAIKFDGLIFNFDEGR